MKKNIFPKNVNYKLREKRNESVVRVMGFPLLVRVKPTAHQQYCFVCREPIQKGEQQILIEAGLWYKHEQGFNAIRGRE